MIPETDYEYYEQHQGVYLDFDSNPEGYECCTACQEPSEELEEGLCEYCFTINKPKTNLNVIYKTNHIRVFKLMNGSFVVESFNKEYKCLKSAKKKADKLSFDIEIGNILFT